MAFYTSWWLSWFPTNTTIRKCIKQVLHSRCFVLLFNSASYKRPFWNSTSAILLLLCLTYVKCVWLYQCQSCFVPLMTDLFCVGSCCNNVPCLRRSVSAHGRAKRLIYVRSWKTWQESDQPGVYIIAIWLPHKWIHLEKDMHISLSSDVFWTFQQHCALVNTICS